MSAKSPKATSKAAGSTSQTPNGTKPSSASSNAAPSKPSSASANQAAASATAASGAASSPSPSSSPAPTHSAPRSGRGKSSIFDGPSLLDEVLAIDAGEDVAISMVDLIVQKSIDKLTEHYIQQVAMAKASKEAVQFVMQAIEWQLLIHDDGEKLPARKEALAIADPASAPPAPSPIDEPTNRARPLEDQIAASLNIPPTYNQIWSCEEEPAPLDLDKWARGVIPTKSSVPGLTSLTMAGGLGATVGRSFQAVQEEDNISRSDSRASFSQRTSSSTPTSIRSPSASSHKPGHSHRPSHMSIREEEVKEAKVVPFKLDITLTKEAIAKEKARELELRRLEKKKREQAAVAAVRAADAAERERMERIQTDLRHKAYTFDNRGNVILVNPIPPEKFLPIVAQPVIKVKDQFLTEEEEAEIAKREKRNRFKKAALLRAAATTTTDPSKSSEEKTASPSSPATSPSRSKSTDIGLQKKKSKPKPKKDLGGFLDLNAAQPSLMQSLTLVKGVTLKQGQQVKLFDPRNAPQPTEAVVDNQSQELRGLTRKEYLKKLQQRKQAEASFLPGSSPSGSGANSARASAAAIGTAAADKASRPTSSRNNASSPSPQSSTSDLGFGHTGTTDADMSELDWGSNGMSQADDQSGEYVNPLEHASHRRPTSGEIFNHQITQDPSWGMNPVGSGSFPIRPPQHARPTSADRQALLGKRAKNPRDRPYVDTRVSSPTRQHLPAAPLGKVVGHGVELPGDKELKETLSPTLSPVKQFAKLSSPSTITTTEKARLYFRQK